jgi:hypothetical protein
VTILRPIVQLGMNSWLDLRPLEIPDEWVHPLQLTRGIGDGLRPNSALFEFPRERQLIQTVLLVDTNALVSNTCPINVYRQQWTAIRTA